MKVGGGEHYSLGGAFISLDIPSYNIQHLRQYSTLAESVHLLIDDGNGAKSQKCNHTPAEQVPNQASRTRLGRASCSLYQAFSRADIVRTRLRGTAGAQPSALLLTTHYEISLPYFHLSIAETAQLVSETAKSIRSIDRSPKSLDIWKLRSHSHHAPNITNMVH